MKHNLRFMAIVGGPLVAAVVIVLVLTSGWFQETGTRSSSDGPGASSTLHDAGLSNPDGVTALDANSGLPLPVSVQQQANPNASVDELYGNVDQKAPGFGGMFYDAQGRLNVYVQDPAQKASAEAAIAAEFGSDRIPPAGINVLTGQYAYTQLNDWYSRMSPDVLAIDGVILTDVDEGANRLRVGVENVSVTSVVEQHLTALEIPRAAVVIEQTEPVVSLTSPGSTLRDKIRPLVGGLQIEFQEGNNESGLCTVGFVATLGNQTGFVTNSHCTGTEGVVAGTLFHQPKDAANKVGEEAKDPPFFPCAGYVLPKTPNPPSIPPNNQNCRHSDSAFVHLNDGVQASLGFIAKPNAIGSMKIEKNFRIVEVKNQPIMGETLNKVGRTTGWSQGPVVETCQSLKIGGVVRLCSDRVGGAAGGGDSGSPVFGITGASAPNQNDVRLFGILYAGPPSGKTFLFSNMGQVQRDLGPLTVLAPGVTPQKPTTPVPTKTPGQQKFSFVNKTTDSASALEVVFDGPVQGPKLITVSKKQFYGTVVPAQPPACLPPTITLFTNPNFNRVKVNWGSKCVFKGDQVILGVTPRTGKKPLKVLDVTWTNLATPIANEEQKFTFVNNALGRATDLQVVFNAGVSNPRVFDSCGNPGPMPTFVPSTTTVANDTVGITWPCFILKGEQITLFVNSTTNPLTVVSVAWRDNSAVTPGSPTATALATRTGTPPKQQDFTFFNNTTGNAGQLEVVFNSEVKGQPSVGQPTTCNAANPLRPTPNPNPPNLTLSNGNKTVTVIWKADCVLMKQPAAGLAGQQVSLNVVAVKNPLKVTSVTWKNLAGAVQPPQVLPTSTAKPTPTQTPRPPVGGIFRNPAVGAAPLGAQRSSSSDAWLLTAVAAIAVASAIALGGGAWYARRRRVR